MNVVAWILPAWAQTVPNGDFEGVDIGWVDTSRICDDPLDGLDPFCDPHPVGFVVDATHTRGAFAGSLGDEFHDEASDYDEFEATSAPFVVTHDRLTWAQFPATVGTAALIGLPAGVRTAGPASADVFTNWERDISAACGTATSVRIDSTTAGPVWYDDIALGGAVCPQFVDVDGDGLCTLGADLDADGTCAAPGELDLPGDCDDDDPALGRCLDLTFSGWLRLERPNTFSVAGATPGERVHVVFSDTLGATCPVGFGGSCLGLADPHDVGSALAGPDGTAVVTVVLPADPEFAAVHVQAVSGSAVSAVAPAWTVPRTTGAHAPDGGVFNGTFDSNDDGWSPDSQAWYSTYGNEDVVEACPPASQVTSPARGAGALEVGAPDGPEQTLCVSVTHGWPFLVTHRGLSWATTGGGTTTVIGTDDGLPLGSTLLGPVRADDGFDEYAVDLSLRCGQSVRIDLGVPQRHDPVVFDDIALRGPVCPQFLDPDGDGLCEAGIDRNGDGDCVSRGERTRRPAPVPLARLLDDFENVPPEIGTPTFTDAEVAPIHTLGTHSAYVDPNVAFQPVFFVTPELFTHQELAVAVTTLGEGDWVDAQLRLDISEALYVSVPWSSAGPGVWEQVRVDVSALCGETADYVTVDANSDLWALDYDGPDTYVLPDWVLFDNLGLAGDVCPEFVDTDGDGTCREGTDTDADGACVSAGEPTPGVVHDPDE